VAQDCDAEVRAVTVANHGGRPRELDLTSYAKGSRRTAAST
jgi:hypothetical protein